MKTLYTLLFTTLLALINANAIFAQCANISTLNCDKIKVATPFSLSFSATVAGTLGNLGFTMADAPTIGMPASPTGFHPGRASISSGALLLNAHFGTITGTRNEQLNALGVGLEPIKDRRYEIITRINALPTTATNGLQQGGIWLGLDQAKHIKIITIASAGSTALHDVQILYEYNNATIASFTVNDVVGTGSDIILKATVNATRREVIGEYSLDGTTFFPIGTITNVAADMFGGKLLTGSAGATDNIVFAGVLSSKVNSADATVYNYLFDYFNINTLLPDIMLSANSLLVSIVQTQSKSVSVDITTSNSQLPTINIDAKDVGNNTPTWLKFNGNLLSNYTYTLNASPEFVMNMDATGLTAGTYSSDITFSSVGYSNTVLRITLQVEALGSRPFVSNSNPSNLAINVPLVFPFSISANSIVYPDVTDAAISTPTVNETNVILERLNSAGTVVENVPAAAVNDTGGGDAITFTALNPLFPNTRYRFSIKTTVTTTKGTQFRPYVITFTTGDLPTGSSAGTDLSKARFEKVDLGSTAIGRFATLIFGPDGKLYGTGMDGKISRWNVAIDGTLSGRQDLTSIATANGGARFIMGLAFDPNATASNLIAYVTHSTPTITAGPEWDGKITKLSGANLQVVQDLIINLPRSTKDHLTNSLVFGPDGNLYIAQGSNNAAGAPDAVWGFRPEHLLSGAVLKLDLSKLPGTLPVNAKTTTDATVVNNAPDNSMLMSDGTYNPYATSSPLTIYASGLRNTYDLVWHSNGFLYAPTNGTAAGGNTPESVAGMRRPDGNFYSDVTIPATNGVQVQRDWLFRFPLKGGATPMQQYIGYYGHPNPLRGEYVLNRGSVDNGKYPANTIADINYRGAAFDFEFNKSPNGAIEYKNESAFGGILKNKLIVARFSGGSDLIILELDPTTKDVVRATTGITGLVDFDNPLELVEDIKTGNMYVSEYDRDNNGVAKITLVRAAQKYIDINPIPLSFIGIQDKPIPSQTINVSVNTGSPGAITLTKRAADTWLVLPNVVKTGNFYSATSSLSVQVQVGTTNIGVNTAGLAPGTYQGQITATSSAYFSEVLTIYLKINAPNAQAPPNVSWTFEGNSPSLNTFYNKATAKINAVDNSGTGILSTQYSINGGSFRNYLGALFLNEVGTFTIVAKVTDGNNTITTTPPTTVRVMPSVLSGAKLYVQNMDGFPEDDHATFSRIQVPFKNQGPNFAANHDVVTLRLHNNGSGSMIIRDLILSDPKKFALFTLNNLTFDKNQLPFTVAPDGFVDLQLQFIAVNMGGRAFNDVNAGAAGNNNNAHETLTIISNDDFSPPSKIIYLHGLWMLRGEGPYEPNINEIIDAFGLKTSTGFQSGRDGKPNPQTLVGDEVISNRFVRADPDKPVYVRQLSSHHGCCQDATSGYWVSPTFVSTRLTSQTGIDGQSLLPRSAARAYSPLWANYGTPAEATFNPTVPFIVRIANDYTDRNLNYQKWVGIRVWKLRNAKGDVIPNAFIMSHDFLGATSNFDYNDDSYVFTNIKPELGSAYSSTLLTSKEHIDFQNANTNSTTTIPITLTNGGLASYPDGSFDPDISIAYFEIVGDSKDEFTLNLPSKMLLKPQENTTLNIIFNPQAVGLKNAALLVHYNSGNSPLRIPLYGIANAGCYTISLASRVKMALNTATGAMTVNGKTWIPDEPFRTSTPSDYKLDFITDVTTKIFGSEDEPIYRSYMSSSSNLRRYKYSFKDASNKNLPDGFYWVRMHFAENYWRASGQRINDILLEGKKILVGFDAYKEVGFKTALVKDFYIEIKGGSLDLESIPLVDRPSIGGIEIFKINQTSPISVTASSIVQPPCGSAQGSITLQASGTSNPVLYRLGRLGNYQASPTFTNLGAGTYTIYVKEDITNACEVFKNFTINSLAINIQYSLATTNADCTNKGGSAIISNITGGTAPYTVTWSHDPNLISNAAYNLSSNTNLQFTITDVYGCGATFSTVIGKLTACASNNAPIVNLLIPNESTPYNTSDVFTFDANTFSDPDGNTLTYTATLSNGNPLPTWLTFTGSLRRFNVAPTTLVNTYSIKVIARDPAGLSVSTTFTITILPLINTAPEVGVGIPDRVTPFNTADVFTFAANAFIDPQGDALIYTSELDNSSPFPAWLSFNATTRRFTVAASTASVGSYDIAVTATDPDGLSITTVFTLTISPAPIGDTDGDGVLDNVDNCPTVPNPTQVIPSWYLDNDGDSYGSGSAAATSCAQPAPVGGKNYVTNNVDCNDADASINPLTAWYLDNDGDTYGAGTAVISCLQPAPVGGKSYVRDNTDCNDNDATSTPTTNWYLDNDGDTYGSGTPIVRCIQPAPLNGKNYVKNNTDCDDNDATLNPTTKWYADADGDTFGNPAVMQTQCAQPIGYVRDNTDCNDTDATLNPTTVWYRDVDGDTFGNSAVMKVQCLQPIGYVRDNTDCNDTDATLKPTAVWYADADGDTFGNPAVAQTQCTQPIGYVKNNTDCNDTDATLNPTTKWYRDLDGDTFGNPAVMQTQCAQPIGYVRDNTDCDDTDATLKPTTVWYRDADGDTFGNPAITQTQCTKPIGYVRDNTDCNDTDATLKPTTVWYVDADGDTFGNPAVAQTQCAQPIGYVKNNTDCNDSDATLNPTTKWYADADSDTYGNPAVVKVQCLQPLGYVSNNTDCDDTNASIKPTTVWFADTDNDGFGNPASSVLACAKPIGYVSNNTDCNDTNATINPTTKWYQDLDNDTFGNPAFMQIQCTQPIGYVINNTDCNDSDATLNPTTKWYKDNDGDGYGGGTATTQCAKPVGNYVKNNTDCNDTDAILNPTTVWYRDADGDTFGNPAITKIQCAKPIGYVRDNTDCNDNDATLKPTTNWYLDNDNDTYGAGTAVTQCVKPTGNYVKNNTDCDDNNAIISTVISWYLDNDGDTYGAGTVVLNCTQPAPVGGKNYVRNNTDCNDTDATLNPTTKWYQDLDNDTYGNPAMVKVQCLQPVGYVRDNTDCNDTDATLKPTTVWYRDADTDGFGNPSSNIIACTKPLGYVSNNTDCNDTDATLKPTTVWYADADNDTYGNPAVVKVQCLQPLGYVRDNTDCNDVDATLNPTTKWYADADSDTYGNPALTQTQCTQPIGYVKNNTDCNDTDATLKPTTVWYADADNDTYGNPAVVKVQCLQPLGYVRDNTDCNDVDATLNPTTKWYADADSDTYGNPALTQTQCTQPIGYVKNNTDCNDTDATLNPTTKWYQDLDSDTYGNPAVVKVQCLQPLGYVRNNTDCDDTNASIKPTTIWYADTDGDGFGNPSSNIIACTKPLGYVSNNTDCNDTDATLNPTTKWYADADSDTYGNPAVVKVQCLQPLGYVRDNTDCNDTDATLNPTTKWYADADNDTYGNPAVVKIQCLQPLGYVRNNIDCDDTDTTLNPITKWYADADNDTYGNPAVVKVQCLQPLGYVRNNTDCDDTNANIKPTTVWYADADSDTYGNPAVVKVQCLQPLGYVRNNTDCNDTDATLNPTTKWYADADSDTYGNPAVVKVQCLQPLGYVRDNTDCNDTDATLNPTTKWYADADSDTYGNPAVVKVQCLQPLGYVRNNTDCNDTDATLNPTTKWYADADSDTYGNPAVVKVQCLQPLGYVRDNTDCNDAKSNINSTTKWYLDQDRDGLGDPTQLLTICVQPDGYVLNNTDNCPSVYNPTGLLPTWYKDIDGDGFGTTSSSIIACVAPSGYVSNNTDCNDNDAKINPNTKWYLDNDQDSFGAGTAILACQAPADGKVYVLNNTDCNDNDKTIYPNALEIRDGKDNNCNGQIDESLVVVNVYPNPSTDGRFYLDYFNPADTWVNLTVVDLNGRVVYQRNQQPLSNGQLQGFLIDLGGNGLIGGVPSGTYILRVQSLTTNRSVKIIKL